MLLPLEIRMGNMYIKLGAVLLLLVMAASAEMEPMIIKEVTERVTDDTPEIIQQVTRRKTANLALYVDPLPQTTKIYAYDQPYLTIGMYRVKKKFHRNLNSTTLFAYGTSEATAAFPGPTIETRRNVPTYVTWENHLPQSHILPWDKKISTAIPPHGGVPAVVHLHGGTVSPENDGHALAWYTANYVDVGSVFTRKTYYYPNVQHSGNLMYHDHALGLTRINLLAGLLGAYVIREPAIETLLNLPSGEEFDRHLVIADREFYANGSIYMNPQGVIPDLHPSWRPEYFGDAITVNGKIWPYLKVQRRKYRFRIINASNARYYNLSFAANNGSTPYSYTVVGSDSSYLAAPVTTMNVVFSVAEIFDVVFDFSKVIESEIELLNSAPWPYPGDPTQALGNLGKVMKFVIAPKKVIDPSTISAKLVSYPPARVNEATETRWLGLYENVNDAGQTINLLINGKKLTDNATETPRSGSTELWNVINLTGDDHPLHLHLAQFQAVAMREVLDWGNFTNCMRTKFDPLQCNLKLGASRAVPEYEKTWKNIVKLPPQWMTSVVVKFNLVDSGKPYPFDATAAPGYVYHCHILDHEDNEMIRPLLLKP